MQKYLRLTKHLIQEFDKVEFKQIPRSPNVLPDEVAKMASSKEATVDAYLMLEIQKHPNIEEIPTFVKQSTSSWMTPIISFLQEGHLPQDIKEARNVRKRVARFTILNDTLYKRGFSMPYLKYVDEEEAKYILKEVHEGSCGDHACPRSLISKVIKTGYFWPKMQEDARNLVKKCDKCQRFAKALATVTEARIQNFIWKNIICRFGIPRTIISDNGWQFDSQNFRDFCSSLGIKNQFSSLGHPQDYNKNPNRRDPFQAHLRHQGNHPGRSRNNQHETRNVQ
ncbi:uncharacterized protein LOC142605747 [Castanea sativa]|uniref:uncharacterized protein LOC142605747 n=1 Tax=Castanea sativa TaxID=21020 RepID=UPI003F64E00D